MDQKSFARVVADALEVSAQAHPVRVEVDKILRQATIHALDKDQVLWRIAIEDPR